MDGWPAPLAAAGEMLALPEVENETKRNETNPQISFGQAWLMIQPSPTHPLLRSNTLVQRADVPIGSCWFSSHP